MVFVVLDDTGFGQLGCFGGPIETPNFDRLAADGLRFNNMHTTALCSPSRSCIITGRNHHRNGMAGITELASGYPGLQRRHAVRERDALGDPARARLQHLHGGQVASDRRATRKRRPGRTTAGRWARGFERFYGFLGGDTSQWYPDLVYDNHQVEPPATPEEGYHLTQDLVDKSIEFIADAKQIDPDKPFYLYFCFGATHAPHHVPKEWADKYAGQFDDGWDAYRERTFARQKELGIVPADAELSRHDPDVPEWDVAARRRRAGCTAGHGGLRRLPEPYRPPHRPPARLPAKSMGELDNTLIMVVSDNGASAEGGPTGTTNEAQFFNNAQEPLEESLKVIDEIGGPKHFNHYPWGWTWAGQHAVPALEARDLPRRRVRPVHRALAAGIKAQGRGPHAVRAHHRHGADRARPARHRAARHDPGRDPVTDPGRELRAHPRRRRGAPADHHTQYFEMLGHRSIYHDGWRAVCPWPGPSFAEAASASAQPISADTLTSSTPRAGSCTTSTRTSPRPTTWRPSNRDRLIAMIGTWYAEAGKYDVLPVDGSALDADARREAAGSPRRATATSTAPTPSRSRTSPRPRVLNRPHSITADVEIPEGGAEGVLLCQGTAAGGYSFFMKDGKLALRAQLRRPRLFRSSPRTRSRPGEHELRFEFEPTGELNMLEGKGAPGRLQLYVDGSWSRPTTPYTTPFVFNPGALIGPTRARRSPPTTRLRSGSPARSTRSPST